jgi:predicted ATP-binding protein involved in virulence
MTESARKPLIADAYKDIPANAMAVFQYAVQSILPDIKEIVWSADLKEPIVRLSNNEIRPFSFLSDGFRYLILLAGELATRSFILNKHLRKEVLKEVHGLVLIDEFGIHLHPALQNDSLLKLQSTFPNVQFIVTTHSPLLLNGLRKEQIHIISVDEDGNRVCGHPEEDIVGLGANDILTSVFGLPTTMDKEFLSLNEEYTILFEKRKNGRLNDAQERRFAELSKMLSRLRIDPNLQLVQEDPITELVKRSIAADGKMIADGKNGIAKEALEQKVDNILKTIFSEPVI